MRSAFGGQELAHARVVRHLRERPRVRPAAAAAARAAVVRRLVRVVEADRSVSDDEHERRQTSGDPDVGEDAADDVRHLAHREPGVRPMGGARPRRSSRSRGRGRGDCRVAHAAPPGREPGKHDAQDQRDQREPAEATVISTAPRTGSRLPRCTL